MVSLQRTICVMLLSLTLMSQSYADNQQFTQYNKKAIALAVAQGILYSGALAGVGLTVLVFRSGKSLNTIPGSMIIACSAACVIGGTLAGFFANKYLIKAEQTNNNKD